MLPKSDRGLRILLHAAWIIIINIIFKILDYFMNTFQILQFSSCTDGTIRYEINILNLQIVIMYVVANILIIYHGITQELFWRQVKIKEKSGYLSTELTRIEEHLINYDHDSIPFEQLSFIERQIGVTNRNIHNEIWILTNSFEENNDSPEGVKLRRAIISNLKTNVNYYYVIPPSAVEDINQLGTKLLSEIGQKEVAGTFQYIIDDALDLIPTLYFDIIMYLKMTPGTEDAIESSSKIYYCFSKEATPNKFYYIKVNSAEIWNRMKKYIKEYKRNKMLGFKPVIGNSEKLSHSSKF